MGTKLGKLFYPILLISVGLTLTVATPVWGDSSGTLDIRVSFYKDAAEEAGSSGNVDRDSSDLELIQDNDAQIVGIRFQNITIPQGYKITSAYIVFTTDEADSGQTDLTIKAQDDDNAPYFSTNDHNISQRESTDAAKSWNDVPEWNTVGEKHQTPDLSALVQEVVDRDGWSSGNAMVFIITGSGKRVAVSCNDESDPLEVPLLHIEYVQDAYDFPVSAANDDAAETDDGAVDLYSADLNFFNSGDSAVGIRFQNVTVAQGAQIIKAYIEFTASATLDVESSQMRIQGQAGDNAAVFASSANNITTRPRTNQQVLWNPLPDWTADEKYQTPDLSAIVQEIVGRSGWTSGNSMAFIMPKEPGQRSAWSFDHDAAQAAVLHLEYTQDAKPYITTDKNSIGASCLQGNNPPADSLTITNSGSAAMNYTLTQDDSWLSPSSSSGSLEPGASAAITLSYTASGLAAGTYVATLTISATDAPNSPKEITVGLTVFEQPQNLGCGHVPVYTDDLVSPAVLILLDVSGSMDRQSRVLPTDVEAYRTPNLSTILQEIVDRTGWQSGNAMAFIISGSGKRTAKSYDKNAMWAPLLHVDYTELGADYQLDIRVSQSTDDAEQEIDDGDMEINHNDLELIYRDADDPHLVGIRFQNVTIPQGATITQAYIQFDPNDTDSVATNLTIHGEDLDDPPTFAATNANIANRTKTSASVPWDSIGAWDSDNWDIRIDIGKAVIGDLVKDRSIAWGFGTWCDVGAWQDEADRTLIHEGTKPYSDAHQLALQDAIAAATPQEGTPFSFSIDGAKNYFSGNKKDQDGSGDLYVDPGCQPKFLIEITDGNGTRGSTVDTTRASTQALAAAGISGIGVGFDLSPDESEQLYEMAKVANEKGNESGTDDIYALHPVINGDAQPFFSYSNYDLIEILNTITESIKGAIFHGSAPAATTSSDLGDTVIVAKFDASRWIGDVEAVRKDANGLWLDTVWSAGNEIPATRSIWTIDSGNNPIEYTEDTLPSDNFSCFQTKPIGDIVNSRPVVVGTPPFWYPFDGYADFAGNTSRDTMVYIGANDGSMHAIDLTTGVEQWAFVPESMHAKLNQAAADSLYDRCEAAYCHQYYVDGSPIVGDIYADFGGAGKEWRTILVIGEREGGEAYFALDVTSGKSFDDADPTKFLWEFSDGELGQSWADASIDRVAVDGSSDTAWAVFFASGYAPDGAQQATKDAYLYGILAHDAGDLWQDAAGNPTPRFMVEQVATANIKNYPQDKPEFEFEVGEKVTGHVSGATGFVASIQRNSVDTATLTLRNVAGTFQDGEQITGNTGGDADLDGTPAADGLQNDALASPLVVDLEGDYISERIYAGNLYGNMYRISDIGRGMTPVVSTLFTFNNTAPNTNPIRARADYAYGSNGDVWIYFGTGIYETQADKTDNQAQYFLGLIDGPTAHATYHPGDLETLQAGFTTVAIDGQDQTVRYVAGTNDDAQPWKMQLYDNNQTNFPGGPASAGTERVITQPLAVSGIVFFTSFIPDNDICTGTGDTWVFAVDYQSGLAATAPVFDLNNDRKFNDDDKVLVNGSLAVPIGIKVGRGQGSQPVLHKDTLFITTSGAGDSGGGNDGEKLFAKKINLPANKVRLKAWIHN